MNRLEAWTLPVQTGQSTVDVGVIFIPTQPYEMDEEDAKALVPPTVTNLRVQDGSPMERSLSADIREEREDLREAAEQTLNVIMDLSLDGNIRWVSPSWTDVIGTRPSQFRANQSRTFCWMTTKTCLLRWLSL